MKLNTKFEFFDIVFLKTDPEQLERIITQVKIQPGASVIYQLSCGATYSEHFEQEFTVEKDMMKTLDK